MSNEFDDFDKTVSIFGSDNNNLQGNEQQLQQTDVQDRVIDDFEDEKTTSFFGAADIPNGQQVQQTEAQDRVIDDFEDEKTTSFFGAVDIPNGQSVQQVVSEFESEQKMIINTYLDFYNAFASEKTKTFMKALFICSIISVVVTVPLVAFGDLVGVLDIAVILIFSIICKSKKVSYAALVLMIYIIVSLALNLLFGMISGGILALVCSILVFKNLKKLENAYKLFQINGEMPASQI